jgi:AmmeMemoRadiSam system protein B/AmmeMemoRadiSam system protein A
MKKGNWVGLCDICCALSVALALVACRATPALEPTVADAGGTPVASTAVPTSMPQTRGVPPGDVHQAEGASRWYPGDPERLRSAVEAYMAQAEVEAVPGRPLAVIVPHAGYVYSGSVAGHAFRALQDAGCVDHTVAVIGDTHAGMGRADVAVWAAGAFETPLGLIHVDEAMAQALVDADSRIEHEKRAFQSEHPVENQLPFIQVACPGAQIVPVVIRYPSLDNAQMLAEALLSALSHTERPVLIVASTDLSHYYPYQQARQIDEVTLQAIASLEPEAVLNSPQRCDELGVVDEPLTMCSMGSVMTALIAARQMGASQATVLHYANSGDVPFGGRDQVVGYGAVVLWEPREGSGGSAYEDVVFALPSLPEKPGEPIVLSPYVQDELLVLARRTIEQFLASEAVPPFRASDPAFQQPLGAYVTYEKDGALRGCLGRLDGDWPVYLNVQYAAIASALNDPRFEPITLEELKDLDIEITVLHPMREISDPKEIWIGRDGVLMRVGDEAGALFLPQVPVDQGWDVEDTLLNLCHKAGLPDDAWKRDDARFYVFGGQWFAEGH